MSPSLRHRLARRLVFVFVAVILATSLALFFHHRGADTEIPADTFTRIVDHVIADLSREPTARRIANSTKMAATSTTL